MRAKKYLWSILCVYFCYLTHGIQAIILSQNNVNFAKQWGFNMADPQSAAYAAGLAAVSTAVAWTGFGKFVSVWIGGEISDHVGRKKLMIGGAALYILCFLGFLFTKSALVASVCGFVSGVATSGFWDASGYPAVQEAYPAAPGSALIGIKFFVSVSGMIYPFLVVHNASSGNWKLNVIIPLVMSIVCLVLAIIAPFAYDDQKKASEGKKDKSDNAVQADLSERFGLSASYISSLLKTALGVRYSDYVAGLRLNHAKELLATTHMTVKDITVECGWYSQSYFTKLFIEREGCTPVEYRKSFGK